MNLPALVTGYAAQAKPEPVWPYYSLQHGPPAVPLTQFRWAYAAYLAGLADAHYENTRDYEGAFEGLALCRNTHSYLYDRLRFLMAAATGVGAKEYQAVGARLMRRNPKDYQVKLAYAVHMVGDPETEIAYAVELHKLRPSDPKYLLIYAAAHETLGIIHRSAGEQSKAVSYYQQFLKLAPPSYPFRDAVQRRIAFNIRQEAIDQQAKKHSEKGYGDAPL